MGKKNNTLKEKQLKFNFELKDSIKGETSLVQDNDISYSKSTRIISFTQVITIAKKNSEDELRKFVLQNTKSF
jgi:hypothetical protein